MINCKMYALFGVIALIGVSCSSSKSATPAPSGTMTKSEGKDKMVKPSTSDTINYESIREQMKGKTETIKGSSK